LADGSRSFDVFNHYREKKAKERQMAGKGWFKALRDAVLGERKSHEVNADLTRPENEELDLSPEEEAILDEVWEEIRCEDADGNPGHVRLNQVFDDLQEGASYTIRFRAKADAPGSIVLKAKSQLPNVGHDIGLGDVIVELTETEKLYQYKFRAKGLAHWNGIHFILGQRTGTVWIKDFTLTKGEK
jgi:hypothetical protein